MILDCLRRSELTVTDFSLVCGVPTHTLYSWRSKFLENGPAGLEDKPRGARGSRLSEEVRRAILLLKDTHPDWGSQRIHDVLLRSQGFSASPGAILRVLTEAGYEVESAPPSQAHRDKKRRFERARPNQLWQSDLFTFTLKRSNRRVHLVGFLDDHSRFLVGHSLAASGSSSMVREALETALVRYGLPEELLTDNGPPYASWRGTTAFSKLLRTRGIEHIRSRPRHPQTLGKIERFWQSLWNECLVTASLASLDEARRLIAEYIDRYNFFRPHQGIGGLVPADRFFGADAAVRETMAQRAQARLERPSQPQELYLTGRVGAQTISLHSEGDRLILVDESGGRREVSLVDGEVSQAGEQPDAARCPQPAEEADPDRSEACGAGSTEAAATEVSRADPAAVSADAEAPTARDAGLPTPRSPGTSPLDQVMRDLRALYAGDLADDLAGDPTDDQAHDTEQR